MKAGESRLDKGSLGTRPDPEVRSSRPKSPQMERRKATRFRYNIASHAMPEANHYHLRLAALHAPREFWGANEKLNSRG
jgi:hypothetical protein